MICDIISHAPQPALEARDSRIHRGEKTETADPLQMTISAFSAARLIEARTSLKLGVPQGMKLEEEEVENLRLKRLTLNA